MKKSNLLLLFIIFLASILRLYQLGSIPYGVVNDEAGYIYSSYSIWKTGHDVAGKFLPLSINLDDSYSPVYIYLDAPFVGILGISPFSGRLPYALLGIGSVYLLYLLAKSLTKNETISLLSALVLTISPWHLQISRSAYDATVALFFYLLAIYIFVRNVNKGNIIWSLPAFLLAFYSYHATKIFFIFFIPFALWHYRMILFKRKKETAFFSVGILCIIFSFFWIIKTQHVTRQEVFLNSNSASKTVNWEREKNLGPKPLQVILSNKPLYFLRVIRENYLEAFSLQYLFLYGETSGLGGTYGLFNRGVLYIIELPLLLFGIYYLIKLKSNPDRWFILILLLLGPLPSTFASDRTYVMRSIMILPFLSIFVGYGIYQLYLILKNKRYYVILMSTFILWYSFLFAEYLYQYYFRYTVYGAESWFRSNHELALYIAKEKNNYQCVYLSGAGRMFLMQYGLYNNINPAYMQKVWQERQQKLDNITFGDTCFQAKDVNKLLPSHSLYITREFCQTDLKPIDRIVDYGEPLHAIWKVYEN